MTATIAKLNDILLKHGSTVTCHREYGGTVCPCRTREGNRDPAWHLANPGAPKCNEAGMLPVVEQFTVKASIQPITGSLQRRNAERILGFFPGEVESDDHIGVFPVTWEGHTLDFSLWLDTGTDYVLYDNRRFIVVSHDKLPDIDGDPNHHWECGLRLANPVRVNA